jgi:hypothetical protein
VVLSAGNPIHGLPFASSVHGGGHDLPLGIHVVRDGLLTLSANEVLSFILAAVVLGRHLVMASRSLPVNRPAAIQPLWLVDAAYQHPSLRRPSISRYPCSSARSQARSNQCGRPGGIEDGEAR